MRRIITCALFFSLTLLLSQSDNFVYEDYFHRTESVVADTVTGHFFVEHYNQAAFGNNPFVSGYNADGELLWEQDFPISDTAFYFGRQRDGNDLIDFDADRLLYLGSPGNDCDFPVDNFILAFLNKADGRVERVYSEQVGYDETGQARDLNYALSPNRNRLAVRLENGILSVNNLLTDPVFEVILANLPISAVTLLDDRTLVYLEPAAITDFYVQLDLVTGVQTSVALPLISNFIEAVSFEGEPYIRTPDSLYAFSLTDVSLSGLFALPATAKVKVAPNHLFVVDGPTASYFSYFPSIDSLGLTQTIAAAGTHINNLTFANERYYLCGNHNLSRFNFAYAYWLTGTGDEVVVTSPYDIASDSIVVDSVLSFSVIPPSAIPYYQGSASISVAYRFKVINRGLLPIESFIQDRPRQGSFACGPFAHLLQDFTTSPLLPGEERWITDTLRLISPFQESSEYNFTLAYTLGRPNGQLDLSPENGQWSIEIQQQYQNPVPSSYVSGDFFINHVHATPDFVNGGQFLHGDAIKSSFLGLGTDFADGKVVAVNTDGSVRWVWEAEAIGWQEGNSIVLDAGPEHIIAASAGAVFCNALIDVNFRIERLNRLTGINERIGQYDFTTFPTELHYFENGTLIADSAGEFLYIYNDSGQIYQIPISTEPITPELIAEPGVPGENPIFAWLEDRLVLYNDAHLFIYDLDNGTEDTISLDVNLRDFTILQDDLYTLTDEGFGIRSSTTGELLFVAPVENTYHFAPSDDQLLLFDATNGKYITFNPNFAAFSPQFVFDLRLFSISQVSINQGRVLTAGEAGILHDVPNSRRHGYAYHLPLPFDDHIRLASSYDIQLLSVSLDRIEEPSDEQLPYVGINLTLEVFNEGERPIQSLTIGVDRNAATSCDYNNTSTHITRYVNNLNIAPGTSELVPLHYLVYSPEITAGMDVNELICINFPNNKLDVDVFNNCATLLITSTENTDAAANPITAFPNPSNHRWSITGIPAGEQNWVLTDLAGKTLQSGVNRFEEATPFFVSARDLPTGIYVLRLGKNVVRLVKN